MPNNDKYTDDDYVAKLLAEDAKKSSQRYASVGLSALLPKRPTKAAPKPNTRFLNHLVREVDTHNAALKKKEELEARIRLRELREKETHDGDDGRERKRQRLDDKNDKDESDDDRRHRRRRKERSKERRRSTSPRDRKRDRDQDRSRTSHRRDRERDRERRRHSRRHYSYSPERDQESGRLSDPSPEPRSRHVRAKNRDDQSKPKKHRRSRSRSVSSWSSDPLDTVIGPQSSKPAIRGRGAHSHSSKSTSNIDSHFSSTYNPALDVHPSLESDLEREDWDMALEALRDRTMWKKKQADRMREAGFGDDEIKKWEKVAGPRSNIDEGNSGDVGDVRWKKKGEAREWDLGKEELT